jgi:hypothetical protein
VSGDAMLTILALDPDAVLRFSPHTRQWYVSARLEVAEHGILASLTEHRRTPEDAVGAYLDALKAVEHPNAVKGRNRSGEDRYYRWNGAAFAEVSR